MTKKLYIVEFGNPDIYSFFILQNAVFIITNSFQDAETKAIIEK